MNLLERSALELAIGELPSEKLPALATEAMTQGFSSPSLLEVACLMPGDISEARHIFENALDELGINIPAPEQATWLLVKDMAMQIVTGNVTPIEGANWIWYKGSFWVEKEGDLRIFGGLVSQCEDHPQGIPDYEKRIKLAAEELLSRSEPRTWIVLQAIPNRSPLHYYPWQTFREIDLTDLPISSDLIGAIAQWGSEFESKFKTNTDGTPRLTKSVATRLFIEHGQSLTERLQFELGDGWNVEYMPPPQALS